jgi:low temperature requirement protein LtrA
MAGFLMMAFAIPEAFGRDALAFGLAYLLVTLVHATLFKHSGNASSATAIWRIAPFNFGGAGLVIAASFVAAPWNWILWTLAVAVFLSSSLFRRAEGFSINPTHFAERHGLVVLIALGESLVAIGTGAQNEAVGLLLATAAILGLALCAALWWAYFDIGESEAETAMAKVPQAQRSRMALYGYGYAHLLIIGGIVAVAAGLKHMIEHLHEPPFAASAWSLGIGVALYLSGNVWFRRTLHLPPEGVRLGVAFLALVTIPLGLRGGGLIQVGALLVLLITMLGLEHSRTSSTGSKRI